MDLTTLKVDHVDLYNQVVGIGRDAAVKDNEQAVTDAVAGEQARCLGIAGAILGDAAETLANVVKSGISADQAQALKGAFGSGPGGEDLETTEKKKDKDSRAEILKGLKAAQGNGLNKQTKTDTPGNKSLDAAAQELAALVD